jgi:tetratricopeptide (TPR) repeat protein
MTIFSERMEQAVFLARSGEREGARTLFAQIVQEAPANFQAWLWLSELSDHLEEQTAMLENAARYAPPGEAGRVDLQAYLNELRGSLALPAPASSSTLKSLPRQNNEYEELFRQAERFSIVGKNDEAIRVLKKVLLLNRRDERAWLLLSELSPDLENKIRALEEVVALNPANDGAAAHLEALRQSQADPLLAGLYLEEQGELDQAIDLYRAIAARSGSAAERTEAFRRIARIENQQKAGQVKNRPPLLNLLRQVTASVRILFF